MYFMACISSGAKKALVSLFDFHMADSTPKQKEKLQKLKVDVENMPICATGATGEKKKRKLSRWQQCIAQERKGKPFDPNAMKKLSKLYKEGKCP